MKKIYQFYLILIICLLAFSCKESILDVKNPNQPSVDGFWKSEADAQNGLNAVYAMFYVEGSWGRWIFFRNNLSSDEGFSQSPWIELADWTRFQYRNYNFWEGGSNIWRDHYKAIYRCNQVLDNVPNIKFAQQVTQDRVIAQAKFLRAFYYTDLANLWEEVPLVLKSSKPGDRLPKSTRDSVWIQIKKDLTEAAAALPAKWEDDKSIGRPTKGAALGLLARANMQTHDYAAAKTVLDWLVVGEGKVNYGLVTNWRDNFTDKNENNVESVFEIQFSNASLSGTGDVVNAAVGQQIQQFFAPRSIGWSDGQARFWVVNEFKKEKTIDNKVDPRLEFTLFYRDCKLDFPGDSLIYSKTWDQGVHDGNWGNQGHGDPDECWFRKFSRDYQKGRSGEDYWSECNFRYLRFADVLLMYAECLNELGQTSDAYQYVDRVRQRATMSPLATAHPEIGNDKTLFLEQLKMERVHELTGEVVRWNDLKRWGEFDTQAKVNKLAQRDPDFLNFEVGRHYRLPIPQSEIDVNPLLVQNTPY